MVAAIVLIETKTTDIPGTAEAIVAIPAVTSLYSVAGKWDLIAIVNVKNHGDLADVISHRIAGTPGVKKTSTHIAFKVYSPDELGAAFDIGLD